MTAEQRKNRDQAVMNMLYLYKKYYPSMEKEIKEAEKASKNK